MANFDIYGTCEVRKDNVTVKELSNILYSSLSRYYPELKLSVTADGVDINGDLKGFFERAVTKASIKLKIEGSQLSYRVDGSASIGNWSYIWLFLGFFTYGVFTFFFIFNLVEFLLSRDKPKKYIEDALKVVEFEVGQSSISSTRKCPYCAEVVKSEAIICRFCGKDLPIILKEEVKVYKSGDVCILLFDKDDNTICPSCNTMLRLDLKEMQEKQFDCPDCKTKVTFTV